MEDIALCSAESGACRLVSRNVAPRGWVEHSTVLPVPERRAFLQVLATRPVFCAFFCWLSH